MLIFPCEGKCCAANEAENKSANCWVKEGRTKAQLYSVIQAGSSRRGPQQTRSKTVIILHQKKEATMKKSTSFLSSCIICLASISQAVSFLSMDSAGIMHTKCPKECKSGGEVVCGSDGKTYTSACHLIKYVCEQKVDLKLLHPGSCECPKSCLKNYKPVCAVDMSTKKEKTYPNICQYKRVACQMKLAKKILAFSKKGPCKKMTKCPISCQDIYAPVCAADNKTYSSVCALKLYSCNQNKRISLIKIGKCETNQCPEHCPTSFRPICGNDGRLHPSECELKLFACRKKALIKRVKGKKGRKLCSKTCVAYCPDGAAPVCGSDGVTYVNECQMMKKNCEKGHKVKVAKRAKCGELLNKISKKK